MQTQADLGLSTDAPHLQVAAYFCPFKNLGPKKTKKNLSPKKLKAHFKQKNLQVMESTRDFTKKIKENLTI